MTTPETAPIEVTQADREAACKYYGYDDEKDLLYWGNVSQHRDVERLATAFARHRTTNETARQDGLREALPRLDDGLIEAALVAHYGKGTTGIDGLDLTANDVNWTFRDGFKRMWAGVRAELKRRAALSDISPLANEAPMDQLQRLGQEFDAANDTGALRDIAAERARQVSVEGWTPEHDDEHADAQMAGAVQGIGE